MSKLTKFLSFLMIVSCMSCAGIKSDIFINKDGSGMYKLQLDMSDIMSGFKNTMDGLMTEDSTKVSEDIPVEVNNEMEESTPMVEEELVKQEEEMDVNDEMDSLEEHYIIYNSVVDDYDNSNDVENVNENVNDGMHTMPEEEVQKQKSKLQLEFMSLMERENIDTTIMVYSFVPDTVLSKLKNPELLKKIKIDLFANKLAEKAKMDLNFSFSNLAELSETFTEMSLAQFYETGDTTGMDSFDSNLESMKNMQIDAKGRQIIVAEYNLSNDNGFGGDSSSFDNMSDEEIKQSLSMFGLQDVAIRYHLPAPLKEVSGDVEYMVLEDNTVEIRIPIVKMMKTQLSPAYIIKY